MVTVEDRAQRITESAMKIQSPFTVDPSLCLYSPQDNVESLQHPRIAAWLKFVEEAYEPRLPAADRKILLFLPCTKTKPYPFSSEHQSINQRLLESDFEPMAEHYLPQQLIARLQTPFTHDVLNLSLLTDGKGTLIHRMVISEPMGVVPYEHIAEYDGMPSPACAYDDPGLFENRGNAVSPWRKDNSAVKISATRWKWGDEEKRHYVLMHNTMSSTVAKVINRIGHNYTDIISWVAPGLTHRSFVIGRDERAAHKVTSRRKIGNGFMELLGANDHLPGKSKIDCLPTIDQCKDAVVRLAKRLDTDMTHATAVYSRGGANATPLALPELLDVLLERINRA